MMAEISLRKMIATATTLAIIALSSVEALPERISLRNAIDGQKFTIRSDELHNTHGKHNPYARLQAHAVTSHNHRSYHRERQIPPFRQHQFLHRRDNDDHDMDANETDKLLMDASFDNDAYENIDNDKIFASEGDESESFITVNGDYF